MKTVLILIVWSMHYTGSPAVTSVDFEDRRACEDAAKALADSQKGVRATYYCASKSSEVRS